MRGRANATSALSIFRDRARHGQFLLTGSQKFTLMKSVSSWLAGRVPGDTGILGETGGNITKCVILLIALQEVKLPPWMERP